MSEDNADRQSLSLVTTDDLYDCDVVILEDGTVAWVGTTFHGPDEILYYAHPGSGPGYSLKSYGTSLRSFVLEGRCLMLSEATAHSLESSIIAAFDDDIQGFIARASLPAGGFETEWIEDVQKLNESPLGDVYYPLDDGNIYRVSGGRFQALSQDLQITPKYRGVVVGDYFSAKENPEWPILTIRPLERPRSV